MHKSGGAVDTGVKEQLTLLPGSPERTPELSRQGQEPHQHISPSRSPPTENVYPSSPIFGHSDGMQGSPLSRDLHGEDFPDGTAASMPAMQAMTSPVPLSSYVDAMRAAESYEEVLQASMPSLAQNAPRLPEGSNAGESDTPCRPWYVQPKAHRAMRQAQAYQQDPSRSLKRWAHDPSGYAATMAVRCQHPARSPFHKPRVAARHVPHQPDQRYYNDHVPRTPDLRYYGERVLPMPEARYPQPQPQQHQEDECYEEQPSHEQHSTAQVDWSDGCYEDGSLSETFRAARAARHAQASRRQRDMYALASGGGVERAIPTLGEIAADEWQGHQG